MTVYDYQLVANVSDTISRETTATELGALCSFEVLQQLGDDVWCVN